MLLRAPLFVLVYGLWLAAVAGCGLLDVTGHTTLAYLLAVAVLVVAGLAVAGRRVTAPAVAGRGVAGRGDAGPAAGRAGGLGAAPLPAARRAPVLVAVLGGIAFGAAACTAEVYLGLAGRDAAGVVVATGCVQVAEHGGGCGPVCEVALAQDRRSLGWMPCDDRVRAGDPAAVRIDPVGFAAAIRAQDAFSRPVALAAGWAGAAGAGLAGLLLCNAVWLGPARDARR
ncbi:hypothetical protein AB0H83_15485 [Dactylosporangium sp. NPDC050688]|uniref:hypothetical protein n=1 Tax=Dactylosporangium sp. NPDC050688 TaxID=3157217 RepID=UPI0033EB9F2C